MVKHYCEKCGKEVRKWFVCSVKTDTDLPRDEPVSIEEINNMRDLVSEYEICYDCFSKFLNSLHVKPQAHFPHLINPDHRSACILREYPRASYHSEQNQYHYYRNGDSNEAEE